MSSAESPWERRTSGQFVRNLDAVAVPVAASVGPWASKGAPALLLRKPRERGRLMPRKIRLSSRL